MAHEVSEYIIRGGAILTMDPKIGDISDGFIHVRDGRIAGIGADVDLTSGVPVYDRSNDILIPGIVDTHWHLWNSILRGYSWGEAGTSYMEAKRSYAPFYTPSWTYRASSIALGEALLSGITTVNNWHHNVRSVDEALAGARAQIDSGVGGRFSFGPMDSQDAALPTDFDDVDAFLEGLQDLENPNGVIVDPGVALRGPYRTPRAVWEPEWSQARARNLPITMHCDRCSREEGCRACGLGLLAENDLLGPDVQLVHIVHASDSDIESVARTGTHVSLSPFTELRSMGFPRATELLREGVIVSLSTDSAACPTGVEPFEQMRCLLSVERARFDSRVLGPRDVLEMATIVGARDLGMEADVGSLSPGKCANVVVIDATAPNMLPCVDPLSTVVLCGRTSNIREVYVNGARKVRDFALTGDLANRCSRDRALELFTEMTSAIGWDRPAWPWLNRNASPTGDG